MEYPFQEYVSLCFVRHKRKPLKFISTSARNINKFPSVILRSDKAKFIIFCSPIRIIHIKLSIASNSIMKRFKYRNLRCIKKTILIPILVLILLFLLVKEVEINDALDSYLPNAKGLKWYRNQNDKQSKELEQPAEVTVSKELEPFVIEPEYYKYIEMFGLHKPGDLGAPVELPANVSEDIKKLIDEGYEKHGFNSFISHMVSYQRRLPDIRSEQCKEYSYNKNLPKASVVIIVHNEHYTLLLRTIYSILNRSPENLLEEVLLVDDASDNEDMSKRLDNFIKTQPKVRIVRSAVRHGIIESRMIGVRNAIGPIVVNLDSHMEVSPFWLEPILDRFVDSNNTLVTPHMDVISKDTLQVFSSIKASQQFGGLKWSMDYTWISIKKYEGKHRKADFAPRPCPVVLGGAHAYHKRFFLDLGSFDGAFDIWGGEDVEMSIHYWLCGGKVEYVPCSKVAHVYRDHKYSFPKSEKGGYRWNTDRIAEVWLDEYKRFYYRACGDTKDRNFGNIEDRLKIKEKLKCKPFKWFVENIFQPETPDELQDPTTIATTKSQLNITTINV